MIKPAKLILPHNAERLLLHTCCAPCCGGIMLRLLDSGIDFTAYFYNPNIVPYAEYEKRKNEIIRFAEKHHIKFINADYEHSHWHIATKNLHNLPERSEKCEECFSLRLTKTAGFAAANNFPVFATSLGFSRWKNIEQVNACGLQAANNYSGTEFWPFNWRKQGGQEFCCEITKQEGFYRQRYCGCTPCPEIDAAELDKVAN